jgi:hypothetical protein
VVIAPLGSEVLAYHAADLGGDSGSGAARSGPDTPSRRYFPATHHSLRGDLLRFWQQHGGMAVFGAPITEVFQAQNGDGSGRVYAMQYFENARLERHPELHDPRYAILLGLLGTEDVEAWGWLVARS